MLDINLLGTIVIESDHCGNGNLASHPKKLAFLAYLASQPQERFVSRDTLVALFWPDSRDKQARHALSQMLHYLRQVLGHEALNTRGAQLIRLNPALSIDVRNFEAAASSGNWDVAADLYTGDLLSEVTVANDPDVADWLDRERQRLRILASKVFWQLGRNQLMSGHFEQSSVSVERAIRFSPADEQACLLFCQEALGGGNVEAARYTLAVFSANLLNVTGDHPSPAFEIMRRKVEETARSARQLTTLEPAAGRTVSVPGVQSATVPDALSNSRHPFVPVRFQRLAAALSVIAVVVALGRLLAVGKLGGQESANSFVQMAIPPFEVENDALQPLADRTLDGVVTKLGASRGLSVITEPNEIDARNVRSRGYLLSVRMVQDGDTTAVAYKLYGAGSRLIVASRPLRVSSIDDLGGSATSIVDLVVQGVGHALAKEVKFLSRDRRAWFRAQGNHLLADSLRVAGALEQALRQYLLTDSLYSTGFNSAEGKMLAAMSRLTVAAAAATTAAMLGHRSLGDSLFVNGETVANNLVSDHPERSEALEARGLLRYRRWMVGTAPSAALLGSAEDDLRGAVQRDPERSSAIVGLSGVLFAHGEYAASNTMARRALELDSFLRDSEEILTRLFLSAFNLSDDSSAEHWCDELDRRVPAKWPSATCRLMLMGWCSNTRPDSHRARKIVSTGMVREPAYKQEHLKPRLEVLRAAVWAREGMVDSARSVIKRIDERSDPELLGLKAAVLLRLGDDDEARKLAERYEAVGPAAALQVRTGRIFRGLKPQK